MLGWLRNLFKKPNREVKGYTPTKFSDLEIGQVFRKVSCSKGIPYIKKEQYVYETYSHSASCIRWYVVNEDFFVARIGKRNVT